MKKLLKLITSFIVIVPTAVTVTACNNQAVHNPTAKFTDLGKTITKAITLSATTAIWGDKDGNAFWFDSTKSGTSQFTNLNKMLFDGFKASDTTAVLDDGTNSFYFDSTKTTGSQFVQLSQDLRVYYSLSSTTGIFQDETNKAYFFDASKIGTSDPLEDLSKVLQTFYPFSTTTGIFSTSGGNAFWFDSSKTGNDRFIDLGKESGNYYSLSTTTGIFVDGGSNAFYFDSTKINPTPASAFENLNQKIDQFVALTATTGVCTNDLVGDDQDLFYFDNSKTGSSKFTDLDRDNIDNIYHLSNSVALISYGSNDNGEIYDASANKFTDLNMPVSGNFFLNSNLPIIIKVGTNDAFVFDVNNKTLKELDKTCNGLYALTNDMAIYRTLDNNGFLFQYN